MKLTDLSYVKSIMEEFGLHFKKKYGQNFLINESVPRRIASHAVQSVGKDTCGILEIGPGIGTLTYELAQQCEKVVSVEIDSSLLPALNKTLADCPNVTILCQDILKVCLKDLVAEHFGNRPVAVCANLPYYITTPILMYLLESGVPFVSITVMIQKEVAQRLCAPPAHSDYGAITAVLAYYAKVRPLFDVAPGSFVPPPSVTSTVISIEPYQEKPYTPKNEALLMRVIRGAFAQRRKTLLNSLQSVFSDFDRNTLCTILESVGIAPTVRGETLSVPDFISIADAIFDATANAPTSLFQKM